MDFDNLLERFAAAVAAHDSTGLAALFTSEGCYDDYFFGRHEGRAEIAAMLDRFYEGGDAFVWRFDDAVCSGERGYAHYLFSYRSREPESAGKTIVFEGVAMFALRDGLIEYYGEVFDRGVAFAQLGYETGRVRKLLDRYAKGLVARADVQRHLRERGPNQEITE